MSRNINLAGNFNPIALLRLRKPFLKKLHGRPAEDPVEFTKAGGGASQSYPGL